MKKKVSPLKKRHRSNSVTAPTSEASKERLLKSAITVFAQKGFSGTTVKDIADASQLNVGLVSYYFDGKEGLFRACLEEFSEERLGIASGILTPPESPEDFRVKLKAWGEQVFQCFLENRDIINVVHKEIESDLPMVQEVLKGTVLRLFENLVEFFKAAQKSKIIRQDLDPLLVAATFHGSYIQMVRSEKIRVNAFGSSMSLTRAPFRKKFLDHSLIMLTQGIFL